MKRKSVGTWFALAGLCLSVPVWAADMPTLRSMAADSALADQAFTGSRAGGALSVDGEGGDGLGARPSGAKSASVTGGLLASGKTPAFRGPSGDRGPGWDYKLDPGKIAFLAVWGAFAGGGLGLLVGWCLGAPLLGLILGAVAGAALLVGWGAPYTGSWKRTSGDERP